MRTTVRSVALWRYCSSQRVVSRSRWLVGSSSSSTSAGATSWRASPSRPRSPPESAEMGSGARLGGVEPQAVQHRVHARGEGVAAVALEALEVAPVALQRRLVGVGRQRGRLLGERALERQQLAERPRRRLPHRRGVAVVAVLLEQRDAHAALPRHLPGGRLHLPGDQAEERRLARAVAPDDPPPVAGADGEGDVREQRRRAELDGRVGDGNDGHGSRIYQGGMTGWRDDGMDCQGLEQSIPSSRCFRWHQNTVSAPTTTCPSLFVRAPRPRAPVS
jgi:hypothetical protein